MRRAFLPALVAVVLAGCGAGTQAPVTTRPPARATDTRTPSPPAGSVAAIYPPGFAEDVTAANVPPAALIPLRTTVIGTWYADTSAGQAIVVGWEARGQDPFRTTRGFVAWRHFDDGGSPWRPVYGAEYRPRSGVQSIHATIADVTGDGEPDALVQALSGVTANCGEYTVVDLAAARPVFARHVCDAAIEPSTSPPGLRVSTAVYAPGDAHCCPSATRVAVLTLGPDGVWTKASSSTVPAG